MKMSKMYMLLSLVFVMLIAPLLVFAQVDMTPVSEVDFLGQVFAFVGGYKGMTALAVTVAVVQLLIMFAKLPTFGKIFTKLTGDMKLLIVTGLTLVAGYLALKVAGVPSSEAIMKTLALPVFQEYIFQLYKQFFAKKV